jgi:hypothetical protein
MLKEVIFEGFTTHNLVPTARDAKTLGRSFLSFQFRHEL